MRRNSKLRLPNRPATREEFRELTRQATEVVAQQRAAAQVAAEALAAGRAAFTDEDGTREERLARTRDSALEFGRTYLPHYFEQAGAPFHEALDKLLSGNYTEEDLACWVEEFSIEVHQGDPTLNLLAIMIPRGHGKSVIAILCDVLRRICHGLDPYITIGSDTLDQAASQLEDLKDELSSNEKIRADFGSLKPDKGLWRSAELIQRDDGRVVWREGRIVTANKIRVDAIGRGGKMRGRRFGQKRPTHIILDDLDNDENVVTKEQRDKSWNWVISAVEPARDPQVGRVVVLGTNIHFDCVVARAVRKTDEDGGRLFTSIKFAAMRRDEDGQLVSVWPSRFPTETLLRKRALLGPSKFGAEYMNDPRDPETQIFQPDRFTYYLPAELHGKELVRILYVDPSKGKKGKGRKKSDFSGFADLLVDRTARISYVLNAFRKRLSPSASKVEVVKWYREVLLTHPYAQLWVEENSFGDILGENFQDELRAQGVDRTVQTLLHTTEKAARLERHSIRVESGGVKFPQRWEKEDRRPEWFGEYEDYPSGAFDDTIDAIESADHVGMNEAVGRPDFKSTGKKNPSASARAY
ncbi:MAG: hypothetical protein ACRD9R_10820 [Pyrinomonadaceae bacterium]